MLAKVTTSNLEPPSSAMTTRAQVLSQLPKDEKSIELLTAKLDAINMSKEVAIQAAKDARTQVKQLEVGSLNEGLGTDCLLKQKLESTVEQCTIPMADQDADKQEHRKPKEDFDPAAYNSLGEKQEQTNSCSTSMQQLIVDTRATELVSLPDVSTVDVLGSMLLSTKTSTMTEPATNSIQMVLCDENLICEILLRLLHASNLVHAALVSKVWLSVVSDPSFLKRFSEHHVPCLLGYYIVADGLLHPRFVALSHPPDLCTMINRAASQFDMWVDVPVTIWGCKNGRLLIDICDKLEVRSHLSPPCAIAAYPQSPMKVHLDESFQYQYHEFLPEDGGDGHEYCRLVLGHRGNEIIAYFFLLNGHIWVVRKSEVTKLPVLPEFVSTPFIAPYGILGHGMSYVMTSWRLIIAVDVESLKISMVELPKDLSEEYYDYDLSQSQLEDSFCLFGLSQSDLRIWVCDLGSSSQGAWSLLNSVSIRDLFGHIATNEITLHGTEELGGLVFLKADGIIYELRINTKKVTKIYELLPDDGDFERIYPCMMVWPPKFPYRDELDENEDSLLTADVAGKIKGRIGGGCSAVVDRQKIRIRLFR